MLFDTRRLRVRRATPADAPFLHALWTSPKVMRYLGFPAGLNVSVEEVARQIVEAGRVDLGARLIADRLEDGIAVGQAKVGMPDLEGVCEPDIKLDPGVWGRGYGTELWQALIDYAFAHSGASAVQGTPHRDNVASIRMQRAAGMTLVGQGVFEDHLALHPGAVPVPYFRLRIFRDRWLDRFGNPPEHVANGEG